MSLLNPATWNVTPASTHTPQTEWVEKALCISAYWSAKAGCYGETQSGLEDITFTDLNEQRARIKRMEQLIAYGQRGALNEDGIEEIQRAYRRLPREFKL